MMHSIANEFSILGHGLLEVGRALIDLIQDIITLSLPDDPGGRGGGQYPFG
ncbi:hypothetical protein ACFVMC_19875 [Nocardia sp. NPDC127579]|uniref:hypothetical protein n=1 Tax=Nocardia sp. NPDC127579 TaxID=3345402 RepID=UPI0036291C0A